MFKKEDTNRCKGVAILLLFFHHLFYTSEYIDKYKLTSLVGIDIKAIMKVAVEARVCVWLFVFLSAYGLSYQYKSYKEGKLKFVLHRQFQLLKGFWIIFVIMFILQSVTMHNIGSIYKGNFLYIFLDFMGWSDFLGTPLLRGVWWYMSLAQVLIIVIPFLYEIVKKLGYYSILFSFLAIQFIPEGITSASGGNYINYLMVAVLAILIMQKNMFSVFKKDLKENKLKAIIRFIALLGGTILILYCRMLMVDDVRRMRSVLAAFSCLGIVMLFYQFKLSFVGKVLEFIGKHSGNMYMTHRFIYGLFPQIIFFSKSIELSFVALIVISLTASLLTEGLKNILRYNIWMDKLENLFWSSNLLKRIAIIDKRENQ